jgi:Cytochrome c
MRVRRFRLTSAVCLVAAALAGVPIARAESPANLYLLNCWGCHGQDGAGIPGTAPSLRDAADFLRVPGGRAYLIQVPGVALSALNDADTASVMNWVIGNFSKGRMPTEFKPYIAGEIHALRRKHLLDVAGTRKRLVAEMIARGIRPVPAVRAGR